MTRTRRTGFRGTERFEVRRKLGSGGMGVVYEAYDADRHETVALKTLHWVDAAAVYRFKKEFRGLADVAHRNLVSLYELIAHEDSWFFTMELVEGSNFLEYVRPGWRASASDSDTTSPPGEFFWPSPKAVPTILEPTDNGELDVERLRSALKQLAEGIGALQRAGRVHRDLKPSNVQVTRSGRVVVLDFGIAADIGGGGFLETVEEGLWGTAAYMAPEQYNKEYTPASDWYAVGVLLYEALTGDLPFGGTAVKILTDKQVRDPPRPEGPGVPDDLGDLAVRLLSRVPSARPNARQILQHLGVAPRESFGSSQTLELGDTVLVGRESELAVLEDAFGTAEGGRAVSVYVHGPSGIGKTALVQHFTSELALAERAVVLGSQCYVRESVPYKGIDGVIDILSRFLKSIPADALDDLIPDDIGALARVFPVLNRVQAVEWRSARTQPVYDQRELRRRAFVALRHLLANIGHERPVVIHIDDLQWADADSADLLNDILRASEPLRLLIIACFRSEELQATPFLQALIETDNATTVRILELSPLTAAETTEVARQRLAAQSSGAGAYAEALVTEAGGNPFLIDQMVRFVLESEAREQTSAVSLSDMLNARMKHMPLGARAMLDVLAVAGQPLQAAVAFQAANLTGDERPLVHRLRISHFLRANAAGDKIGIYHDRIQEHLAEQLDPAQTADIHRRVARRLVANQIDDPQALYQHYLGMGDQAQAAQHAVRIAERSQDALAFDRAAQFYRRALALVPENHAQATAWHIGLADALASAGAGAEAAKSYLQAASTASGHRALELERRAGEQLLMTGRIDQGLTVIRRVLAKVGLRLPPTPRRALFALVLRRLRLALRGLTFNVVEEKDASPDDLVRVDVCWAVAAGLSLVDNIQGASFQSLHLLLALKVGEPHRVARALALEAGTSATGGNRTAKRTGRLFDKAWAMAKHLQSRYAEGMCSVMSAVEAYHRGHWDEAGRFAHKAEELLTDELSLVAWEINSARLYQVYHLFMIGAVNELTTLSQRFLSDAVERQNVFGSVTFRAGWSSLVWLRNDDVQGAADALHAAQDLLPKQGFHVTHYICMLARGLIDLYTGDGAAGVRHMDEIWKPLQRSMLTRIQNLRVNALLQRARCRIASAAASGNRQLLRAAERDATKVQREKLAWATALATLVRAGVAEHRGDAETAVARLTDGISRLSECHMYLWRAAAVRRKGELIGGVEGTALIEEAEMWMENQGIRAPEKMARALVP